ncbi:Beta-1 [Emericellopsis cladophorae]|uniref:Beta-1 n=1 Tax=Emericellopsis cladophorae TaxID=2686198 RepID=A0A9P9Y464_9HYPO|nr:Beta-1 [Emericellopsis cladophorae]KAI6783162.1 Beta-1 [Emericellopsis cladophorae]
MIALGAFYSAGQVTRSTYICFEPLDSHSWTLALQLISLILDAMIIVLLWRVMAWTRTIKLRLSTLGVVLIASSVSTGLVGAGSAAFEVTSHFSLAIGSVYSFDILVDSIAFALLAIFAAAWICETSPLLPSSTVTVLVGTLNFWTSAATFGDWVHTQRYAILIPGWCTLLSFGFFLRFQEVKSVVWMPRSPLAFLLVMLGIAITMRQGMKGTPSYPRHPISDLIYKANIEHDRWVTKATSSDTVKVGAKNYEELHGGKVAPPNFDKWYEYAHGSIVIDSFDQIDADLQPFWNYPPSVLRDRAEAIIQGPGIGAIRLKDGLASHSDSGAEASDADLQQLTAMINKFAKNLPDMVLPINLGSAPRVLPPWEETTGHYDATLGGMVDPMTKRSPVAVNDTENSVDLRSPAQALPATAETPGISSNEYREMLLGACPPSSRSRTQPQWDASRFCVHCIRRHSKHGFLTKWDRSLQTCAQPDLRNLHDLYMTSPISEPIRKLVPLFSPFKVDVYSDILVPLPRATLGGDPDMPWTFKRRYDSLYWKGMVGQRDTNPQALRGSQKYRLLHLFLSPNSRDKVTLLLPRNKDQTSFGYEPTSAAQAGSVAPFDIGIGGFSDCNSTHCDVVKTAFGAREETQEPLEYRYVLLLDEDGAPPSQLMRTIGSGSVPFVSTIFRSWYTERLQPYLHFVPVDPRFHALHSTYLYFTGTEKRVGINGRDTMMKARDDDGEYIAKQGRKWVEQALTDKDMEVYLFRLLLEWGRLIDDERDTIGYQKDDQGVYNNVGWTTQGSVS